MSKPTIILNEQTPNIFEILGKAGRELEDKAIKKEMIDKVTKSKSYNEAINIIKEYVEIIYAEKEYDEEEYENN